MSTASADAENLRRFRWPQAVLARFVARHHLAASVLWTAVFSLFTVLNLLAYTSIYPSDAERAQLAASFGSNVGLHLLLGQPLHIESAVGFTDWRGLGTILLVAGIWGIMLGTRTFRGEESAGRWEMFLAGQTTARRATAQTLAGIGLNLALVFAALTALLLLVRSQEPAVTVGGAFSYALVVGLGVGMFVAMGALLSQIVSTRSRAMAMAAAIFGASFVLRGAADSVNGAQWLLNFTPLGWLEKVHPLTANHAAWLLPPVVLVMGLSAASIFLAGRRDPGSGLVADRDTARPRLRLLRTPLGLNVRLTRATMAAWLAGLMVMALLFGSLAQSAGDALSSSSAAQQAIGRLTTSTKFVGAVTFLGMVFFILTALTSLFTASNVAATRREEAEGYVENLLVRPVSRRCWLSGRVLLAVLGIALAATLVGLAVWAMANAQNIGVDFTTIFKASVSMTAAPLLVLGIGIAAFGWFPRHASKIAFGVVAWSFLIQMIGSLLKLNHWILDISLFHHLPLVPAVEPNWKPVITYACLGLVGIGLGLLRFQRRDLVSD